MDSSPLEPTTPHLVYLILAGFLLVYSLFSEFIRNRIHLSEPPLATLLGVLIGGIVLDLLKHSPWHQKDNIAQEITRVVVGIQVFSVGIDLPAGYVARHWKSLFYLIGPNMVVGWFISTAIVYWTLSLPFGTSLLIAACLTPTDPVLSASVLGEAKFSSRVPRRLKHLLSAESGCNDGSAFPLLYAAIFALTKPTAGEAIKHWFVEVILWQCSLGIVVGAIIGLAANKLLRFSENNGYIQKSAMFAFYILLAVFTVGVGSALGLDDFLVSFSAGAAFCWDGWFSEKTHKMKLPAIIDLILNSAFFVYFGTAIPWDAYKGHLSFGRLFACVILILLLRRIPTILAMKRFMPDIHTYSEALFAGHFGPIGVGALFLALEARARLETGESIPLPHPPEHSKFEATIRDIRPVVCFIVLGSIVVHGLSALVMSIYGSLTRKSGERAPLLGGESERLTGMLNSNGGLSESEASEEE